MELSKHVLIAVSGLMLLCLLVFGLFGVGQGGLQIPRYNMTDGLLQNTLCEIFNLLSAFLQPRSYCDQTQLCDSLFWHGRMRAVEKKYRYVSCIV